MLKQLFALLSFFSDKTNGFALFSKGNILVGSLLLATTISPLYAQKTTTKLGEEELPPVPVPKKDTIVEESGVFCYVVEQMPQFKGGEKALYKFINDSLRYPKEALDKRQHGRVICRFSVTKDGNIENVSVLKGISPSIDNEAIRVLKSMPKWIPGKQNGKDVPGWYTLPIMFALPKE